MTLPTVLEYLASVTAWIYDLSKDIPEAQPARSQFNQKRQLANTTELERLQNHISFINYFMETNFPKHGYFSQRLGYCLEEYSKNIQRYLAHAQNYKDKMNTGQYYLYGEKLNTSCQLNPYNNKVQADIAYKWLNKNVITMAINVEQYNECGPEFYATFLQGCLGMLISHSISIAMVISMQSDDDSSDAFEMSDSATAFLIFNIVITTLASLLRYIFAMDANRALDDLESYLRNSNVVAPMRGYTSITPFFEGALVASQLYMNGLYLIETNNHPALQFPSLLFYPTGFICGRLLGRSADATQRMVYHLYSKTATTVSEATPLLRRDPEAATAADNKITAYNAINFEPTRLGRPGPRATCSIL